MEGFENQIFYNTTNFKINYGFNEIILLNGKFSITAGNRKFTNQASIICSDEPK